MSPKDNTRYLKLVLAALVGGGSLVIVLVYGPSALLTAVPILLLGAALILLPWLVLTAIEYLRHRYLDD